MHRWLLVLVTFAAAGIRLPAQRRPTQGLSQHRGRPCRRHDPHDQVAPNPYQMVTDFTFDGVTPFADAYTSRPSDAPDQLDNALANARAGAIVRGGVYWDAYRDAVSNVVLLDKKTGVHLAEWNL